MKLLQHISFDRNECEVLLVRFKWLKEFINSKVEDCSSNDDDADEGVVVVVVDVVNVSKDNAGEIDADDAWDDWEKDSVHNDNDVVLVVVVVLVSMEVQ